MMANQPPVPSEPSRKAVVRQRAQSALAGALFRAPKLLWYAENVVLSARLRQQVGALTDRLGQEVPPRFKQREAMWSSVAVPALDRAPNPVRCLEFGVASGAATAWWMSHYPKFTAWDGFDTFSGLPTAWDRGGVSVLEQGAFAQPDGGDGLPKIASTCPLKWHVGLIDDTIAEISRAESESLLVLIDVDLLEPTRVVLDWLGRNGASGDVVYFDEVLDPFNEGLALREAMDSGLKFRILGYTATALTIVLE